MPTIASSVVPAPQSWDEFEDITLAATKLRWRSDKFQRNGRAGQKQDGVDVFGRVDGNGYIGIQCKNTVSGISIKVIEAEIANAEKFEPNLNQLYIATTAKRDAPLQKKVRVLSDARLGGGKFCVTILFWDDIQQDLAKDEKVFFVHYPQFRSNVDSARFEAEQTNQSAMLNEILKRTGSAADAEALGRIRHEVAKAVADNPDQDSAEIVEQVVYLIQSRREALEKLEATPVEDNRVRSFQAAAEQALSNDDDAAAIAALLEAEAAIGERQEIDARARANYTSIRAGLLLGQGDWQAADAAWEQAAAMLMPFDVVAGEAIIWEAGDRLKQFGETFAQTPALVASEQRWRALADAAEKRDDVERGAGAQNNLGLVLCVQGGRTGGDAGLVLLAQAVEAYRAALTVYTEAAMPANWATTQNNLGVVLQEQGGRTGGDAGLALLAQAVEAYRAALTVRTEAAMPADWAATQNNLGNVLSMQGGRTGGDAGLALLAQAVEAYHAALTVYTPKHFSHNRELASDNLAQAEAAIAARRG